MAEVQTAWLKNKQDEKIAPKTLVSQVYDSEGETLGVVLENKADLDENGKLPLSQLPDDIPTGEADWETLKNRPTNLGYIVGSEPGEVIIDTGGSGGTPYWNDILDKPTNISYYDEDDTGTAQDSFDNLFVKKNDIVNDLTTGGTNKVLSAEMGKTLNNSLSSKSSILVKNYTVTLTASKTTDTSWQVDITQSGYTPMSYSISRGNSTSSSVAMGVEIFNSNKISGYYINKLSSDITATIKVAYYKNS